MWTRRQCVQLPASSMSPAHTLSHPVRPPPPLLCTTGPSTFPCFSWVHVKHDHCSCPRLPSWPLPRLHCWVLCCPLQTCPLQSHDRSPVPKLMPFYLKPDIPAGPRPPMAVLGLPVGALLPSRHSPETRSHLQTRHLQPCCTQTAMLFSTFSPIFNKLHEIFNTFL